MRSPPSHLPSVLLAHLQGWPSGLAHSGITASDGLDEGLSRHRSSLPEGWTFADDDHLPGRAELIWKLGGVEEDSSDFHVGGVLLEHVDVFDASTGRWDRIWRFRIFTG